MKKSTTKPGPAEISAKGAAGRMPLYGKVSARKAALRIAVSYAFISTLWILCSGWVLHKWVHNEMLEAELEDLKGLAFVLTTAALMGWALHRIFSHMQQTARELAARERQLRSVGDNLPDSYIFQYTRGADGKQRFTYISAGVERIHGMPATALLTDASALFSLGSPAQLAAMQAAEARSAQDLSDFEMDVRLPHPDGQERFLHIRSRPRRMEDGELCWDGMVTDLTEHKLADQKIARQAALINSLLESIPDPVFFKDSNSIYLGCNASFSKMVGKPLESIIGHTDYELFPAAEAEAFREYDRQMLASRTPCLNEEWVTFPDGARKLLETLKTPYWGPDGELIGVLGLSRDITARRAAAEALKRSEQFSRAILDSVASHIAVLDREGIILAVNARWQAFAESNRLPDGRLAESIGVGTNYLEACRERRGGCATEGPMVYEGIREVLGGRRSSFTMEYPCHSPQEERWFSMSVTPLGDAAAGVVISHTNITQRKRSEAALLESSERYRSLFRNMLNGFAHCRMLFDDAGVPVDFLYLDVNPAFERLTGWKNAVGKRISELIPGVQKSDPRLFESYGRVVLTGNPEYFEHHVTALNNWYSVSVYRPSPGHFVAVFNIITERKRAEQRLSRLNECLLNFGSDHETNINQLIALLGTQLEPTWAVYNRLEGDQLRAVGRWHTPDDFCAVGAAQGHVSFDVIRAAKPDVTIIHDLLASCYAQTDPNVARNGLQTYVGVGVFLGTRCIGSLSLVYQHHQVPNPGELNLLGIVASAISVEEKRRLAGSALRDSEENFRAMFEMASIGLAQAEPETGRLLRVNHKFCEMVGYTEAELLQLSPREFTHPEDVEKTVESFRKLWTGAATSIRMEKRYLSKSGEVVWASVNMGILHDAAGKPIRTMGAIEDITGRKQLEAQFLRAQRLEAVGALASGVAHDLNNILSPVLMCAPLLRTNAHDPESLKLLETIESCARRGADIVRQLLTFARGKPGSRVPLPMRHLLREVEKLIQETFPRSIQPHLVTSPGLWSVLGDSTQIHQALLNLCVNARDAMPDGGVLTLGAENCPLDEAEAAQIPGGKPGNYLRLTVTDTGTGIPAEIMARVFDPFFTTKEPGKGTGLGLATVLGIINGHGGFLTVHSLEGMGTTFKLYLPAVAEVAPPLVAIPSSAIPRGRGQLILVVDDEAEIRASTRKLLEQQGYQVVTAANGAEALDIFDHRRAELRAVLTDMMMPRINGVELVHELERRGNVVPILGMTGLAERNGDINLNNLDLAKLLLKPFNNEELLTELHRALAAA